MSARVFLVFCVYFFSCNVLNAGATLPEYCGKESYSYSPLRKGAKGQGYELKQVHVIMRHGDRTRAGMAPCWANDTAVWDCLLTSASLPVVKHDIHDITVDRVYRDVYMTGRNDMQGDCGLGHLTFKGYKQQELNGQNLRKAYIDTDSFLLTIPAMKSFLEQMSAQALALGLFPASSPSSGKSQVVDINLMDKDYDDIEPNPRVCPKLEQYEREFYATDMWQKHYNEQTKPLLIEVQQALGLEYNLTSYGLSHIADCLFVHTCHGFPIPSTISDDLMARIGHELEFMWYASYSYPTIQKYSQVGIGFLIGEIWEVSHAILQAFNASDYKWSPYASMIQLELLQLTNGTTTDYVVRLLYQGQERTIPYCRGSPCSLGQFKEYIGEIVPQDPPTDCKVTNPEIMNGPHPPRARRARVLF
ncbi:hypothetical protein OS493_030647 [Desmophyllum pertusum]|uniref:Acid phosphatase n=1 Tax=Desmophyllum pertusum TaxID=174260 RepID=A0A9W9ZJX8_9CNID|nr:hypothetical protein OS493_030647 [Desmophyllum pertusum]